MNILLKASLNSKKYSLECADCVRSERVFQMRFKCTSNAVRKKRFLRGSALPTSLERGGKLRCNLHRRRCHTVALALVVRVRVLCLGRVPEGNGGGAQGGVAVVARLQKGHERCTEFFGRKRNAAVALEERLDRLGPRRGRVWRGRIVALVEEVVLRSGVEVCECGVLVDKSTHLGVERGPTGSEHGGGLVVRGAREVELKKVGFADKRHPELQVAHHTCARACVSRECK